MYGYSVSKDFLPYREGDRDIKARIVRKFNNLHAEYYYELYFLESGWFRGTRWVETEWTYDFDKAKRWAKHYGVKIEL